MTDLPATVHNERTKLTAGWINGLAIALFAVGGLAPMVSTVYGTTHLSWLLAIGIVICFFASSALHYLARRTLKGLKP